MYSRSDQVFALGFKDDSQRDLLVEIDLQQNEFRVVDPPQPNGLKNIGQFALLVGVISVQQVRVLVFAEKVKAAGFIRQHKIHEIQTVKFVYSAKEAEVVGEFKETLDLLAAHFSAGHYFSYTLDLTRSWDKKNEHNIKFSVNQQMMVGETDRALKLLQNHVIEGYVFTQVVDPQSPVNTTLIMRVSHEQNLIEVSFLLWKRQGHTFIVSAFLSDLGRDDTLSRVMELLKFKKKIAILNCDNKDREGNLKARAQLEEQLRDTEGVKYKLLAHKKAPNSCETLIVDSKEVHTINKVQESFR